MAGTPGIASVTFEVYDTADMTSEMWEQSAKFFSLTYGIWSRSAPQSPVPGKRVKMSAKKLKEQLIPSQGGSTYIRAMGGGRLIGNVFACRWDYQGRQVCWVTQLVVDYQFRKRGLATRMLEKLREVHANDRGFGVLSSHPAAIRAALRAFGRGLDDVNLEMIRTHAHAILSSSPVGYVREAKPHGALFEQVQDGSVSSAFTNFYVDHAEPLAALDEVRCKGIPWPFGELPEGHEFLVLVKGKEPGRGNRGREQESSEF